MALITIKVSPDTRRMLRVIAAHFGITIHEAAMQCAWAQMKKHKLRLTAANGLTGKLRGKK